MIPGDTSRRSRSLLALLPGLLLCVSTAFAAGSHASHLDRTKNPVGCAACHKGHGQRGTAMLRTSKEGFCFNCHSFGGSGERIQAKTDMMTVFSKKSRHPVVETSIYHVAGEELPERSPSAMRHVACEDCHNIHDITPEKKWGDVKGYGAGMRRVDDVQNEYELCYKCHSDSANLPPNEKNKRLEFDMNNPSYHPVEGPGKNYRVPSLKGRLNTASTITCSDCHGNDDPYGPKGPHASNYDFMLKDRYIKTEGAESPASYALCYSCHDRSSILNNESFALHKEHIIYQRTPCSACHTPHGTNRNANLIEFDTQFVGFTQLASYAPAQDGRPLCFLKCHIGGKDYTHDNAFYTVKKWPR
ncbi:MAG: cytochrome c3 family protein [Nitrospiraceae bacterium]|nr:cytochrome c3 family protein [Nitrospiraceae bacterium]